ncbi:MAG TPA: carboxypeptidase-like regulatory domain-containing protein [Terracidiphilus sp.]
MGDSAEKAPILGKLLAIALAALLGGATAIAQAPATGSLEGRLTDLYAKPLNGATVVLRNLSTGAEFQAITGKNGAYHVSGLVPGAYELEAATAHSGVGHVSGILISTGHAARVLTAVALRDQSALAAVPSQTRWIPGGSPVSQARLATRAAASAPAVPPAAEIASVTPAVRPVSPAVPAFAKPEVHPRADASLVANGSPTAAMALPSASIAMAGSRSATQASRTGLILSATAAASLRAALAMPIDLPRSIEAVALEPDEAEAAASSTLSEQELQALPVSGRASDMAIDSLPAERIESADNASGFPRQTTASSAERGGTRLAFGTSGAIRRETAALLVPTANESALRTIQVIEENGHSAIGSAQTRSGADQAGRLHGSAFFFDRQGLLAARNPFATWVKETAPATSKTVPVFSALPWSPDDRRTRWGAGLGGPLRRDKLFWFAAIDSERRDHDGVASVKHPDSFFAQPSDDELQVLSARLDLSGAAPVEAGLATYSSMLETLAGLLGPASRTSTENSAFARVDWKAAEKHRFTLEATGAQWDSPGGGLTRVQENYGTHSFGVSRGSEVWLLARWDAIVTPNLLAVTQASMGRHILAHEPDTPSPFEQSLNINAWGQLPQMVVDSRYGFSIGNPAQFGQGSYPDEHSYAGREGIDWRHGSLLLRAGFDLRHDTDATSFVRNHTGTYHYSRIENFASDALVFEQFGLDDALNPTHQHNCDQRGKAWRDGTGQLHGVGYLPCYSYYTQTVGPAEWHVDTTDMAGFTALQWKPGKTLIVSAGIRWDRQFAPSDIPLVANADLPLAGRVPSLGNEWAPRIGMAWGTHESRWPVFRLGYGMYYGPTSNSILETALTHTGSPHGDLDLFARPTDNLPGKPGVAPPFPYVLAGTSVAARKAGATEVAHTYRNVEVQQAVASLEEELPGRVQMSLSGVATLGRRLPVTVDTNFDPTLNPGAITYEVVDASGKGPLKASQITVPFFASWPSAGTSGGRLNPNYEQITALQSRANSTYEAGVLRLSRSGRRGLSLNLHYTYGHTTDWNPDEGALQTRASVLDPLDFQQEYGTSNLDLRHSASADAIWHSPWKLHGTAAPFANGWMLSGIGRYHSGLPYTMHTAGSLAQVLEEGGGLAVALGPGMNGYGGANRVYGVGRNTYRYPATWKMDMRIAKRFSLGNQRELELLAQSFNLFNHQNVTELETVGYYLDSGSSAASVPRLSFLTGLKSGQTEFGQPLNVNATDYYRERQFDFGLRFRFKHAPFD